MLLGHHLLDLWVQIKSVKEGGSSLRRTRCHRRGLPKRCGRLAGGKDLPRMRGPLFTWQVDTKPQAPGDRRLYDTRTWFYFVEREGALIEQLPGGAMVSTRLTHELQQIMQYGGTVSYTHLRAHET